MGEDSRGEYVLKSKHEIRDPIHNFIKISSTERKVVDSTPFQRLRYIHQLALTYLVYPGATHKRFEHCLGVMELASRVYDVITDSQNINESIRDIVPTEVFDIEYWKRVVRMAALCHDLGHLPFSHAAEEHLLPDGWNHEKLTVEIINCEEMAEIWKDLNIKPEHVAKIAVGPKYYPDNTFNDWETILSEIIVGDALGVDRIDYLLRDSYHSGVAYGKFDHYRLIDTIRILPRQYSDSMEPALGIESGGLHSAEAMLLARYFMYTQLYFHSVRRIYDKHLMDFLSMWLPSNKFSIELSDHLNLTDNEILTGLFKAAKDENNPGHDPASRIVNRKHYKLLYWRNPVDFNKNNNAAELIFRELCDRFGEANVFYDQYRQKGGVIDFPVISDDGSIVSSRAISDVLEDIPPIVVDFIYINPEYEKEGNKWLKEHREHILEQREVEEEEF